MPELLALHRAAYHSATPVSKEIRITAPARTLTCNVNAVSVYTGPQYRGTLLLMRDLTDHYSGRADEDGFCGQREP